MRCTHADAGQKEAMRARRGHACFRLPSVAPSYLEHEDGS